MKNALALLALGATMTAITAGAANPATLKFQALSDNYLDLVFFPFNPTTGTLTGYHQYDTQLEDYSRRSIDAQVASLKTYETRIAVVPPEALDQATRGDRDMVLNSIRAALLSLETIRAWEKNPDTYSSGVTNSAFSIMERKFASPDERLKSLIAREKLMPSRLDQARENLKNPPHIYTEIAIEQLPGSISFFQHDLPLAFAEAKDPALKAEFEKTNAAVIEALSKYMEWLKTDLLPRSNGDYRIGADTFAKKLLYDEMVDIPLDKLVEIDRADMKKNQQHFIQVAKELEPQKDPQAVLLQLGQNHPAPDQLLNAFRATFDSLIAFIKDHKIVTIPSDVRPILEETPPFMRATTLASMDTPGPYEKNATEAYFNVTLPDPSMTPAEVEGYMHSFNVGTVISTAVHETYPGHYIQFLWVPAGSQPHPQGCSVPPPTSRAGLTTPNR